MYTFIEFKIVHSFCNGQIEWRDDNFSLNYSIQFLSTAPPPLRWFKLNIQKKAGKEIDKISLNGGEKIYLETLKCKKLFWDQKNYLGRKFNILARAPSATQFTKSYSRRLPTLQLESQNQAKNIPAGLPSSLIKI